MYQSYKEKTEARRALGVSAPSLTAQEVTAFFRSITNGEHSAHNETLLDLITHMTPCGVDDAALTKAECLWRFARGEWTSPLITAPKAIALLGTMQGGYNVQYLVAALDINELAPFAAQALKYLIMVYDAFNEVAERANNGNAYALSVVQSWAEAEWFFSRPDIAETLSLTAFKVNGETNTDDLSPAQDAFTRPDIPLHALAMYKNARSGIQPDQSGKVGCINQITQAKSLGHDIAFVGDVVGTGSSRKSAANSVMWHFGQDIPFVPNKRTGSIVIGGKIAPIFFATLEDSGALPIECDVSQIKMNDELTIHPYQGVIKNNKNDVVSQFDLKAGILDEVKAGGRINYLIGRRLTQAARLHLGLPEFERFKDTKQNIVDAKFTLAQKMVGQACDQQGVLPGQFCEPKTTTVGSQDTTGAMTRDEIKDLACLSFSAPLVMQSFCHTAAYPKKVDAELHQSLPEFIEQRKGVALRPGDGVIHSWLNRMLVPDTVGTGGDSHTRFPIGISFPAGSGLVAYAAATGTMPLTMPESVLVRFKGKLQSGITLRDLVHAIPLKAIESGLLNTDTANKINIFNGRIIEIEGLDHLSVEQAFELTDASAERSAAACTIKLNLDSVITHTQSNVSLIEWMIREGYGDKATLKSRIEVMLKWLDNPSLLQADEGAEYAAVIEIDLNDIKEPIVCCPNDPDKAARLSEVAGTNIDEAFVGSCMTNIGHFRASSTLLSHLNGEQTQAQLWLAPPTRMDDKQLHREGAKSAYAIAGARVEMPGCSLCMGNQARVKAGCTAVSTSTRNFPNRLGQGANVYLASAELATVAAILGRLPTAKEYQQHVEGVLTNDHYRYLRFDLMPEYNQSLNIACV
ncbi:bifunctional aconitate hydratase 2/2-methylisocitrate dehydratase [Photobacterium sanguinicancri]|uniref:bifunctional aconitate hydratase 2/2-methylisocitrate dehydratase n=1 Tax=Photobacterium sanguinicancri TaxID=875932 RepID=UPI0021C280A8|nr:bifunctional aconitate hydratase 2/2-methylisocitrate dehydratase [Photobacterium sanguinicancri]